MRVDIWMYMQYCLFNLFVARCTFPYYIQKGCKFNLWLLHFHVTLLRWTLCIEMVFISWWMPLDTFLNATWFPFTCEIGKRTRGLPMKIPVVNPLRQMALRQQSKFRTNMNWTWEPSQGPCYCQFMSWSLKHEMKVKDTNHHGFKALASLTKGW